MSLLLTGTDGRPVGFPRVSGDEPARPKTERTETMFSPRERG